MLQTGQSYFGSDTEDLQYKALVLQTFHVNAAYCIWNGIFLQRTYNTRQDIVLML